MSNKAGKSIHPYIMAGDGGADRLKSQLLFPENSGATAVELRIPFSDPVADGPLSNKLESVL